MPTLPRRFHLQRHHDPTGISGTGIVAVGVQWPDRTATVRWLGTRPSTVHWDCIDDAEAIHGHGGATEIVWHDEEQPAVPVQREQPAGAAAHRRPPTPGMLQARRGAAHATPHPVRVPAREPLQDRAWRNGAVRIPDEIHADLCDESSDGIPTSWLAYLDRDTERWHLTSETYDGDAVMLPSAGDMQPMLRRDVEAEFGPLRITEQ